MNGVYPTPESIQAQGILVCIYATGFTYMLLIRPRRIKSRALRRIVIVIDSSSGYELTT